MVGAANTSLRARRKRLSSIRRVGREAVAFARLASLLHRDTAPMVPAGARDGDDVVVLLHGLFATAGVLRPLRRRLEADAGAHVASFTYGPGPGVEELASRLAELIDRLPSGVRAHLVGHSLGGLVIRWYVQLLGGDPRVVQTISLGSPFEGSPGARLMPGAAGNDIAPDSVVLRRLAETAHVADEVRHLSIAAEDDTVAGPDAALGWGHRIEVPDCGHNGLLYDRRVASHVVSRVLALQPKV